MISRTNIRCKVCGLIMLLSDFNAPMVKCRNYSCAASYMDYIHADDYEAMSEADVRRQTRIDLGNHVDVLENYLRDLDEWLAEHDNHIADVGKMIKEEK